MPWRRRRVTEVEEPPAGPPRRPLLWPWLLLLLLLVGTGLALAYFLTQDDDGAEDRVPEVVGLRAQEAVERLRAEGYPADMRRRIEPTRRGRVVEQEPDAGTELDPGRTVVIIVARGPGTVDVPNVVGLPVAEAFERVQGARLRARSVEAFARQARGRVVRQRPVAGEEARRGSLVVLTVSQGRRLVAVPSVIGQRASQAGASLRGVGLRANVVRVPAAEPRGIVVDQNPAAGARAPRGSPVRLNVSDGTRAGSTVPTTGRATVPNVVGLRDTDATARLQQAGFRVSTTSVSSNRPTGTVVSQSPSGGTVATRGSNVSITVSGGPRVRTVPNVVDETEAAARRILRDAGFTVRAVDRAVTDPARDGIVVDQDPDAGSRVQGTTEVRIFVGRLS